MTPGKAALFAVVLLALLAAWALVRTAVRRYQDTKAIFDDLAADETEHVAQLARPTVVVLPDGFTCLRCEENPAMPDRLWCAVCAPLVDEFPAEPIERGAL